MIGLVGGMTWHSTIKYYRLLNERSEALRGPRSTPESLIVTLDYAPLFRMAVNDEWTAVADRLARAVATLEGGGATLVALTAVTAHRLFDSVAASANRPCVHVLDAAGSSVRQRGVKRVGVLATRFAAGQDFIDARLAPAGVESVLRPAAADQAAIDAVVENQLAHGMVTSAAREAIDDIAGRLRQRGADALLLACTELPLLYPDDNMPADMIDAVTLHVDAILNHDRGTP